MPDDGVSTGRNMWQTGDGTTCIKI